jgi:hypothetical protein
MSFTADQLLVISTMIANATRSVVAIGTMASRDAFGGTCRVQPGTQPQAVKVPGNVPAQVGARVVLLRTGPTEWTVIATYGERSLDVYDTAGSHTWNKTAASGGVWARVRCWGGNGAGGGAQLTSATQLAAGGGGQGGGYAESLILLASLPDEVEVTVGDGGAGVAAASGGSGTASSFGALVIADFGNGGVGAAATPSLGYANGGSRVQTNVGDITAQGDGGGTGCRLSLSGLGAAAGGHGGGGAFRGGGARSTGNLGGGGAGDPGAGGAGSGAWNTLGQGANRAGGDGSPGMVAVEVF